MTRKLITGVNNVAKLYDVDPKLLLSIAILEDLNRPFWFRVLEHLLYKSGIYKPRTFGLMQTSSPRPINDKESIEHAALLIKKISKESKDIKMIGIKYNGSVEYGKCLSFLYNNLKKKSEGQKWD